MRKISSSGGTGDCLIVAAKILKELNGAFEWRHFSSHQCHANACNEIIGYMATSPSSKFIHTKNTEQEARNYGEYINTDCNIAQSLFMLPMLPKKATLPFDAWMSVMLAKPYICVQFSAGRPKDSTRRTIAGDVFRQLQSIFPGYHIVMVNQKRLDPIPTCAINATGTVSILDAFNIINNASVFVGQDGVLAYYAMMTKVPTLINFHMHTLPKHYMNPSWEKKSVMVVGGNNLTKIPEPALKELKEKYENSICL